LKIKIQTKQGALRNQKQPNLMWSMRPTNTT
jgi:hypothetical protein